MCFPVPCFINIAYQYLTILFTVIHCMVPPVSNATPNSSSTIVKNTDVTYTCQTGYSHTNGDLTRTCQADSSLTGSLPVCTSKLKYSSEKHLYFVVILRGYLGSTPTYRLIRMKDTS